MTLDYRAIAKLIKDELNDTEEGFVAFFSRPLYRDERAIIAKTNEFLSGIFLLEFGFRVNNVDWYRLNEPEAQGLIEHILKFRVYVSSKSFENQAKSIAIDFISTLGENRIFFTNAVYKDNFNCSVGKPVFGSIEHGILIYDDKTIGILWINDTD